MVENDGLAVVKEIAGRHEVRAVDRHRDGGVQAERGGTSGPGRLGTLQAADDILMRHDADTSTTAGLQQRFGACSVLRMEARVDDVLQRSRRKRPEGGDELRRGRGVLRVDEQQSVVADLHGAVAIRPDEHGDIPLHRQDVHLGAARSGDGLRTALRGGDERRSSDTHGREEQRSRHRAVGDPQLANELQLQKRSQRFLGL